MNYQSNNNLIKTAQNSLYNRYNNIKGSNFNIPDHQNPASNPYQNNLQSSSHNDINNRVADGYRRRLTETNNPQNNFNYSQMNKYPPTGNQQSHLATKGNLKFDSMMPQSNFQRDTKMQKTVRFKDIEEPTQKESKSQGDDYYQQYKKFMDNNNGGNPDFMKQKINFEKDEKLVSFTNPHAPELNKLHKQHLELVKPTYKSKRGGSNKTNLTSENNPLVYKPNEEIPKYQPKSHVNQAGGKPPVFKSERLSREPPKYTGSGGVLFTNETSAGNPLNPHNPEMLEYYKKINSQKVAMNPFKKNGRRRNRGYGGGGGYGGGYGGGGGMKRGGGGIAFNI